MQWVAFDFGRPPFVALDEQSRRGAAERHRRREEQRPSRNQLLGLAHVRDDPLERLPRARRHAGERERRAHQSQKRAARDRIGDRFYLGREFVVQPLLEFGVVGSLFERAPKGFRAHGLPST